MEIKKVAVLGSGVMGSAIAGHLANAGIASLLLDIVPPQFADDDKKAGLTETDPGFRNKFAINAINNQPFGPARTPLGLTFAFVNPPPPSGGRRPPPHRRPDCRPSGRPHHRLRARG